MHLNAGATSLSRVHAIALYTVHALLCLCSGSATAGWQNTADGRRSSCTWHKT